jgi:uncharacterized protein (TIGR00251 family)
MKAAWCSRHGEAVRLSVQVLPNAKKTEVVGLIDGALKIRLKAQPIEGQANEELIRFIATQIKLPKKQISVVRGLTSRQKIIEIKTQQECDVVSQMLLPT